MSVDSKLKKNRGVNGRLARLSVQALAVAVVLGCAGGEKWSAAPVTPPDFPAPPVGLKRVSNFAEMYRLDLGARAGNGASFDRTGGNADGGLGWLRKEGERYILLDEQGPGVLTHLWNVHPALIAPPPGEYAIYIDDAAEPLVEGPTADFFSGEKAPFTFPLVAGAKISSGGFFSYVAIPFEKRIVIATTGEPAYYDFSFMKVADPLTLASIDWLKDAAAANKLLARAGRDPYAKRNERKILTDKAGAPDAESNLFKVEIEGEGRVEKLAIRVQDGTEDDLRDLRLTIVFDDRSTPSVDAPLFPFFAAASPRSEKILSLPMVALKNDWYICYFPMPFKTRAVIALKSASGSSTRPIRYEIAWRPTPIAPDFGYFTARYRQERPTVNGEDYLLMEVDGRGKYVGATMVMENPYQDQDPAQLPNPRWYLEGDIRVYTDGSLTPGYYGTGTEDYFNSGWYFLTGPYSLSFNGNPLHKIDPHETTTAYRFHVSDDIPFYHGIRVGIEHGAVSKTKVDYASVAYSYERDEPSLVLCDEIDIGDLSSEQAHVYVEDGTGPVGQGLRFEGDRDDVTLVDDGRYGASSATFNTIVNFTNRGLRLRRRFDQAQGRQAAQVYVDGVTAAVWQVSRDNTYLRWHEDDIDLPPSLSEEKGIAQIEIRPLAGSAPWNASRYQVFCYVTP